MNAARDALVQRYLPLALHVARRLWDGYPLVRRIGTFDDVCQEARLALLRAAELWDAGHASGASFKTFAFTWTLLRVSSLAKRHGLIRVPARKWADPDAARAAKNVHRFGVDRDGAEVCPKLVRDPDAHAYDDLYRALDRLPASRREVIRARFGLGMEPQTQVEIGAARGVSKQRVEQIERDALERLRRELKESA